MDSLNNNSLFIGHPYVMQADELHSRLCAEISYLNEKKTMYFEVENKYNDYLCVDLSDAFILAIYYFASYNGMDIVCAAPASERLLYQINRFFTPTANKMNSIHYKPIHIQATPTTIKYEANNAVGTAVSSGVDSFYSILSNFKTSYHEYDVTHLLVANLFNKYESEEMVREKFAVLINNEKPVADELGLDMVSMYTNHHEFWFPDYVEYYSFRICSYVMAMQKLFHTYYISAGTMFQDSNFRSEDSTDYDVFNTAVASNDNVTFYMSGGECGRVQKIDYISDSPTVKKHLHVCTLDDHKNCSSCDKCMRTMVSLDIVGKLSDYADIFDLKKYNARKTKYWGKVLAEAKDNVYGVLNIELKKEAKEHGLQIPVASYFLNWFMWTPYIFLKTVLKKSKIIKSVYYRLKIDYLVYGKEKAELYRFNKEL